MNNNQLSIFRRIYSSPWFYPGLVCVVFVVVTRGQILSALRPMWRFLLPVLGVYLLFRYIKYKMRTRIAMFTRKLQDEILKQQQQMQQQGAAGYRGPFGSQAAGGGFGSGRVVDTTASSPVIEICPQCGTPKSSGQCRH